MTACACMASNGTGSLLFIDDMTEDGRSCMNSGVYGNIGPHSGFFFFNPRLFSPHLFGSEFLQATKTIETYPVLYLNGITGNRKRAIQLNPMRQKCTSK